MRYALLNSGNNRRIIQRDVASKLKIHIQLERKTEFALQLNKRKFENISIENHSTH